MKAIILAAGRGRRMGGLTDFSPKCLSEIHGRALLDIQIEALTKAGIDEIGIVTGYKRELLSNRNLVEFVNTRWESTNMLTSLSCAAKWLTSDTCIVSYSDIFYDYHAIESLMSINSDLAVSFDPNWLSLWTRRFGDPLLDAETFRLNKEGRLLEIGYHPKSVDEIEGQYMGLIRLSPRGWSEMERLRLLLEPSERDAKHMTGILQDVIEANRVPVDAIAYMGNWGEVDTPEDLSLYTTK